MPKSLSLLFAVLSIIFLSAMSISISHSFKLVLLFGLLTLLTIGCGFIVKSKLRKK